MIVRVKQVKCASCFKSVRAIIDDPACSERRNTNMKHPNETSNPLNLRRNGGAGDSAAQTLPTKGDDNVESAYRAGSNSFVLAIFMLTTYWIDVLKNFEERSSTRPSQSSFIPQLSRDQRLYLHCTVQQRSSSTFSHLV